MEKILPNEVFYDELASDYDDMISFKKAVEKKKNLLKNFVTDEMKSAADIGCGSGVDSISLSSLGLKVTAFDPSTEMLKIAKANSERMNVKIEFHNYSAENIPNEFDEKFDLVISLGNTFANIPKERFLKSLKRCYDILKPNGQLLIQVLNYEKIVAYKQRIVSITEGADKYFIRFYDFLDEHIIFNILTFNKTEPAQNKLISSKIYPHSRENFESGLERAGFNSVQFYSDFQLAPYNKEQAKDLLVVASKI
jgi:ubiquinone/menaquinone biosynthesis C-methylase UbiE